MRQRREERIQQQQRPATHIVRIIVHRPEVEHGIAMPRKRMKVRDFEYPYDDMQVGDSFAVHESETKISAVTSRISSHNRQNPDTRFTTRTLINDEGEKYVRVWRVI